MRKRDGRFGVADLVPFTNINTNTRSVSCPGKRQRITKDLCQAV